MKLTIELVPKPAWGSNLRNAVSVSDWDKIRKQCYADANNQCEVCGAKGRMEAHEKWSFVDNRIVLEGLICLCHDCHEVKHIGLAEMRGRFEPALQHFMKINKMSKQESMFYIREVFNLYKTRSGEPWKLDLDYLKKLGYNIKE